MNLPPAIAALAPEIVLAVAAVVILMLGLSPRAALRGAAPILSLVGLLASLWVGTMIRSMGDGASAPGLIDDVLVWYVRLLVCVVGVLIVLVNRHVPDSGSTGEFFALLLFSLAGISIVAAADDLLLLFLGLELVSVPTYVMIGLSRDHDETREATVKYFFLGAFASAITLYGMSFLYGAAGTTAMATPDGFDHKVAAVLMHVTAASGLARLGLLLVIAGLAFKIAAVPLHFYVPDVYQGAASPVTGMLGFVPKFAGFVALIRVLDLTGWLFDDRLFWLLWAMAAATMTVGNTLALMQRNNVKRTLAYSSIAHTGYMLVALLAGPGGQPGLGDESPLRSGIAALLFYMAVYGIMNLGAFAALAYFRSRETGEPVESFEDLSVAARSRPAAGIGMAVCCLGLMGLPPTAGMLGKLYLFSSALATPANGPHRMAMVVLVIVGVLNAAIGAAYYLRIIAACMLGERREDAAEPTQDDALRIGFGICAVLVVVLFIRPAPLTELARHAAQVFRVQSPVTRQLTRHDAPIPRTKNLVARSHADAAAGD